MTKRKEIDWAACEADYRTGTFSNRQLADQYGCGESAVRDRAKRYGWEKDLTAAVRKATNAKLLRANLRTTDVRADAQIVDTAADVRVELVRQHRKTLARAQATADKLQAELDRSTDHIDEIEEAIEEETAGDKTPQRRNMMLKAVSLQGRASTALALSQTVKNLIPLERQAFNLQDDGGDGDGGKVIVEIIRFGETG